MNTRQARLMMRVAMAADRFFSGDDRGLLWFRSWEYRLRGVEGFIEQCDLMSKKLYEVRANFPIQRLKAAKRYTNELTKREKNKPTHYLILLRHELALKNKP
jgi:hypothetical protein